MKKLLASILLIAVLVVAAVTCPKKDAHSEKLAQVVNQSVKATVKEHAGSDIALVSSLLTGGIVKGVINEMIDVDNYLFFSIGKIKLPTESKTISVGFFNNVKTIDTEDLTAAIEKKAGSAIENLFN